MDREKIVALVTRFPKSKCLWCQAYQSTITDYTPPITEIMHCTKRLEPDKCGRNFDPKQGGDAVPV